ncbi:MAG: permease prefix domain 2-containing transporter, partial [Bacteroidota bacterium]
MKHPEIPAFAYRLFKWFCKKDLFEELEGDLEETFLRNKKLYGLKKARRIYVREVLKMIRPTVISPPKSGPG